VTLYSYVALIAIGI